MKLVTSAVLAGLITCTFGASAATTVGPTASLTHSEGTSTLNGKLTYSADFVKPLVQPFVSNTAKFKAGDSYSANNVMGYFHVTSLDKGDYEVTSITATGANATAFTGDAKSGIVTITKAVPLNNDRKANMTAISGAVANDDFYIGIYPAAPITPAAGVTDIAVTLTSYSS